MTGVVGCEDNRASRIHTELRAHQIKRVGVHSGVRLIEKNQLRVADQRTSHADALALTAGQMTHP